MNKKARKKLIGALHKISSPESYSDMQIILDEKFYEENPSLIRGVPVFSKPCSGFEATAYYSDIINGSNLYYEYGSCEDGENVYVVKNLPENKNYE
tara:strand:+ start:259 stop:546 length:288 start_codon:yes stop_codon:yes gene_type:complete